MLPRTIVYPDADESVRPLFADERRARLERFGAFAIHFDRPESVQEYAERIQNASALLLGWDLPVEVMQKARHLEVISFAGVGAGNFVDLAEAASRGITICNCPGYANNTVAEHTIALMLAVARNLTRLDQTTRNGHWDQSVAGVELRGRTLGLIGFGGIGRRVCEIAMSLGMKVVAWTRNPDADRTAGQQVRFDSMDEVLRISDVVSIHVALTPETTNLIGTNEIARMKPGVILINTARGAIIDEAAMVEALRSGHIRAAGLDVFTEEPLAAAHPLTSLDNVTLSPHIAFNTPESTAVLYDLAIDNIIHYFEGNPRNIVFAPDAAPGE